MPTEKVVLEHLRYIRARIDQLVTDLAEIKQDTKAQRHGNDWQDNCLHELSKNWHMTEKEVLDKILLDSYLLMVRDKAQPQKHSKEDDKYLRS